MTMGVQRKPRMVPPMMRKKLVVVGDGECGKTCMMLVYSRNTFPQRYEPTIFENYLAELRVSTMWSLHVNCLSFVVKYLRKSATSVAHACTTVALLSNQPCIAPFSASPPWYRRQCILPYSTSKPVHFCYLFWTYDIGLYLAHGTHPSLYSFGYFAGAY